MKRFITLVVCAVLMAIATAPVSAQTTASADVTVTVLSALEIVNLPGTTSLDFGSVAPNSSAAIAHGSGVDFRISGADNANVIVSFTAPATLTNANGSSVGFSADFQGSSSNDASSASAVASGAPRTLSATGEHFLWLGGSITVGNILPGVYTGVFNVSVAY